MLLGSSNRGSLAQVCGAVMGKEAGVQGIQARVSSGCGGRGEDCDFLSLLGDHSSGVVWRNGQLGPAPYECA